LLLAAGWADTLSLMFMFRRDARRLTLNRLLRSAPVRRALAAVLIPMLLLAGFGGTTLIAHAHSGHGTHFHADWLKPEPHFSSPQHQSPHGAKAAACIHRDSDNFNTWPCDICPLSIEQPGFPPCGEGSEGLAISIPDDEQVVVREADVLAALKAAQFVQYVLAVVWKAPDVSEETGSPGGREPIGPGLLCALSACERLVRTSQALRL